LTEERKPAWKIKINGKGAGIILEKPATKEMVLKYLEKRFPKYSIEVIY